MWCCTEGHWHWEQGTQEKTAPLLDYIFYKPEFIVTLRFEKTYNQQIRKITVQKKNKKEMLMKGMLTCLQQAMFLKCNDYYSKHIYTRHYYVRICFINMLPFSFYLSIDENHEQNKSQLSLKCVFIKDCFNDHSK